MDSQKKRAAPATRENTTATSDSYYTTGDKITVLETVGPCLTKIYKSDGTTDAYDDAASFKVKTVEVADLPALAALLGKLHKNKKRCLIAGAPKAEMQPGNVPG